MHPMHTLNEIDRRDYLEFLERQYREGMELAAQSDLLDLIPVSSVHLHRTPSLLEQVSPQQDLPLEPESDAPIDTYFALFSCSGLVRRADGEIGETNRFQVAITFPPVYMQRSIMPQVLTWLAPTTAWHPNIDPANRQVCVGHMEKKTELVDLIYQLHQIITYANVTVDERDCLNPAAAQWARRRLSTFPIDMRPLRRQDLTAA